MVQKFLMENLYLSRKQAKQVMLISPIASVLAFGALFTLATIGYLF